MMIKQAAEGHLAIHDLRRLTDNADYQWLLNADTVTSNPEFSLHRTNGCMIHADGDLVIDKNLVEIKTARRRNKQMEGWRQLAGYVVLNSMRPAAIEIEQVTLWYVRFGRPMTFPVDTLFRPNGRVVLQQFFEEYLGCR